MYQRGVKDFYRFKIDPSFDSEGNICFKSGQEPAFGRSYNWWYKNAKLFNVPLRSCLGTKSQYIAFLGVLLKQLVIMGWTVNESWNAVCNNSEKLGHYWDSENSNDYFEPTGSREIGGFCDLGNIRKLLANDSVLSEFWIAAGHVGNVGNDYTLSHLEHFSCCNFNLYSEVGWLVLDCEHN